MSKQYMMQRIQKSCIFYVSVSKKGGRFGEQFTLGAAFVKKGTVPRNGRRMLTLSLANFQISV